MMSEIRHDECKNKPYYFEMFLKEAGKATRTPATPKQPEVGPGTELKSLLSLVGITALENCKCNKYAAEMNNRGIDWCQDNVATIVSWLEAEAKSRRLPFSAAAAKLIVKLSIRRAKKKG
jgi:hypothetical protein